MRLSVRHVTTYAYDPAPERCALRLKLYPSVFEAQQVDNWKVSVNGAAVPALLTTGMGDRESIWTAREPQEKVEIIAEGEVTTTDAAGLVRGLREMARPAVFLRESPLATADTAIAALAQGAAGGSTVDRLHALCAAISDTIEYVPGSTDTRTPAALALKRGSGVCQDHAHVMIAGARSMGVPARYVVGYLLAEEDSVTQTHAWAEAFVPELGWIGFDPANRLCPTERYVRLACGLDSDDAAPIRGSLSGHGGEMLVANVDISQTRQAQDQGRQGQNQGQQ
ncbi:MAG: transglutaminase family protein [Alphaproteobacteria bacterium]|nr:transglutaminase family protein [Alphaproteobacteria bacterium]